MAAGAAGLAHSRDWAPGHSCREKAARRPSNPSRNVHLRREAGGEHPSETLTMAVLGLHRMHPVCMPAGGQAREGLGGSSHPQFWWARLQRPDLSPTAPRSPEQVYSNICLTCPLTTSPEYIPARRLLQFRRPPRLELLALLSTGALPERCFCDHDTDGYSPGAKRSRAKRQSKARC